MTVKQTKMQEKFTPGEWDSDPDFSDEIYDSEEYYIAIVYERDTLEETDANRHLIRAAPDLYHALKNLLPHVEALVPHNSEYGERAAADIQAARDAIAKAIG